MQWRLVLVVLQVWLLFSRPARAVDAPGLTVETGSPDAFCPDLAQTRDAVRRRLGSLQVEGRSGWRARYTIGHAPDGNPREFVRLELFNPQGVIELSRDLPIEGESCSTMAEVIALVLDRHFRSLTPREPGRPAPDDSSAREPAPAVVAGSPAAGAAPAAPRVDAQTTTARRALLSGQWSESTGRAAAGARGIMELGSGLQLGSSLHFDLGRQREALPRGGEVEAWSGGFRAHLGWAAELGPALGYVGPSLLFSLQRASTRGVPENGEHFRSIWAAGVEAGLVVFLGRGIFLELNGALELTVPPLSGELFIDEREVLEPASFQPWIGLGAGHDFSF